MADHENPKRDAQSQQDEAFFFVRMLRVEDHPRVFVQECRARLLEANTVLPAIGDILPTVPLEAESLHVECVTTV